MERAELLIDLDGKFHVKDPTGAIVTVDDFRKFYRNGDLYLASKGYTSREKFLEQVEKARECEMI